MDDPRDDATDPTDGLGTTPDQEPAPSAPPDPTDEPTPVDSGAPSGNEMAIALTPSQLAVGGAIVAGLLVVGVRLLLGRRRGRG